MKQSTHILISSFLNPIFITYRLFYFQEYFAQFGSVRKIQQLLWNDSGKNKKRGYGFIYFTDTDAADKVGHVMNYVDHIHIQNNVSLIIMC